MCLGIPGEIVAIEDAARRLATVEIAGERRTVNVATLLPDGAPAESCVGAWVLVHMGFATQRVDAEEARRTVALLAELASIQQAARGGG